MYRSKTYLNDFKPFKINVDHFLLKIFLKCNFLFLIITIKPSTNYATHCGSRSMVASLQSELVEICTTGALTLGVYELHQQPIIFVHVTNSRRIPTTKDNNIVNSYINSC